MQQNTQDDVKNDIINRTKTKSLYIKTYGCQMNVYDSQKIGDLLHSHGFNLSDSPNNSDMVVLNTCHIREKAAEKVYSELGRIKILKDKKRAKGEDMIIALAGCVSQAEGDQVFKRAPFVDIVVGPQSYHNLPEMIESVKRKKKWVLNLDFTPNDKFDKIKATNSNRGASAFLSIQEGCDKFCHFCVVPYTRGAEFSRPIEEVYRDALILSTNGVKEIDLLGQNVSGYKYIDESGNTSTIATLVQKVAKIDGIKRIRYTTSHPRDMAEDIFQLHRDEEKLMPFLHLPVQSGSDALLRAMNRGHTRDFYLNIIDKLRQARPDIAFSSDFIVGYPGESDKDFEDTVKIVKEVGFSQCYSFCYSPRPGTPASVATNQVPEDIKKERLYILQELIRQKQKDFNVSCIGKKMQVLITEQSKKNNQMAGKSPYMQTVNVTAPQNTLNEFVDVIITDASQNCLKGEMLA